MTTKLKTIVHEIKELSLPEQMELTHIISLNLSRRYGQPDQVIPEENFWQSPSLAQLVRAKAPPVIEDIDTLAGDFWPEEESVDEFLDYIYTQRAEDRRRD